MNITAEQERSIIMGILKCMKVSDEDASIVADVTVDADLKGFSSHGIGRFPQYIRGLKAGTINSETEITIEKETDSMALLNGNHKFGHVVTYNAMEIAKKKQRKMELVLWEFMTLTTSVWLVTTLTWQ
jgi:L-2-hydroxycarboxylate dehydrogenase (NAD+)